MAEKSWRDLMGGHKKLSGLYDLKKTLGRGHFAVVKLAQHIFTGEKVAIKVIDKTKLDHTSMIHLDNEVTCMKLVQHPNVVRLYEVIDTKTKLYLILELGDGGDMYDYIMKHDQGLEDDKAKEYFAQILSAISYCHKMHVVHRDLKPENVVFFESQGLVKLTDFGFSNRYHPGKKLSTSCGSLAYSAPEILLGEEYDAPAVDVWSLGVILYMLVCGEAPFNEANDSETLTNIMDCKYKVMDHVSKECQDLIESMIIREPSERVKLEDIRNHPWLKGCTTLENDAFSSTPVLSKDLVSDELHLSIMDKMVQGNLANHEEIEKAINENQYNHITSTYFLFAHQSLQAQNLAENPMETEASLQKSKTLPVAVHTGSNNVFLPQNTDNLPIIKPCVVAYASSPPCQQAFLTPAYQPVHSANLSLTSESDIIEESSPCSSNSSLHFSNHLYHHKGDKKNSPPFPREHLTITPRHGFSVAKGGIDTLIEEEERSRSQTTTDDEDDNILNSQDEEDITSARIISPVQLASQLRASLSMKRLKKRKSAPVLNEICEENEADIDQSMICETSYQRLDNKHQHRRRQIASERQPHGGSILDSDDTALRIDSEIVESDVFEPYQSEDVVPELNLDASATFTSRTGRQAHRRSHKSSGSETSDEDSESRRASRSSLSALVLSTISRHRRDSSGDRDGSGSGGGRGWGGRRNSGPGSYGGSENAMKQRGETESAAGENTTGGERQDKMEECATGVDNNNFNNSSCADVVNERAFFRCITPNMFIPHSVSDHGEDVLNNARGRRSTKRPPILCYNVLEKRSKSAESNQSSNCNSSQTSSARSSCSSISIGNRRGRFLPAHRIGKNSRSTMSDTGLVLRWNNLRHTAIPTSSSSSSIASLAVTIASSSSSRYLCSSPMALHRPHSDSSVTGDNVTPRNLVSRTKKRQSRSTSLPRPCRYVRNNIVNNRAASCGPYISHGPSRKRQCLPAHSAPLVTIQPCIPESQMATIEPGTRHPDHFYSSTEVKESNVKRSNISLASSTCSCSKYVVDPINELAPSPSDESEGYLNISLTRHGRNMQTFKPYQRRPSTESLSQEKEFAEGVQEDYKIAPAKSSSRVKVSLLSYISSDMIFRRKLDSKGSSSSSFGSGKWVELGSGHNRLKTLPGSRSYRVLSSENFSCDELGRKTKPDCCIIA